MFRIKNQCIQKNCEHLQCQRKIIFFSLSYLAGLWGNSVRCPDFPLPGYFLHFLQGNPGVFQSQARNVVSSVWVFHRVSIQSDMPREESMRHSDQMPGTSKLAPLDVEEQRLYFKLSWVLTALHCISKGKSSQPVEDSFRPLVSCR